MLGLVTKESREIIKIGLIIIVTKTCLLVDLVPLV